MGPPSEHPAQNELLAFAMRRLDRGALLAIERHIADCKDCERTVHELAGRVELTEVNCQGNTVDTSEPQSVVHGASDQLALDAGIPSSAADDRVQQTTKQVSSGKDTTRSLNNQHLSDFQRCWDDDHSFTAEAFLQLSGLELRRETFAELIDLERTLRLNRFCDMETSPVTGLTAIAEDRAPANKTAREPERFGRYIVKKALSRGAFGMVYHAEDPVLGRDVAIKSPHLNSKLGDAARSEFEREARLLCRLEHAHILPVYDFGITETGRPYLVCKLVSASTLESRLANRKLNFHEATRVIIEIARALHHAHSNNVVHRDVKPANILMEENGHAWLADFGLGLEAPKPELSQDRSGTPLYWSPEQAESKSHLVDGRSDTFSLGIILYEAITGEHPFRGSTTSAITKRILHTDVRPPRQIDDRIPRKIEDACMRALRRNPIERYSTAADFAEDLEEAATYQPKPIDTSAIELSRELDALIERLAENTHEIWAKRRIEEGWMVGTSRDDRKLTHPDLVPFDQLSRTEQDYDRIVVRSVLLAAIAMGTKITPPSQ